MGNLAKASLPYLPALLGFGHIFNSYFTSSLGCPMSSQTQQVQSQAHSCQSQRAPLPGLSVSVAVSMFHLVELPLNSVLIFSDTFESFAQIDISYFLMSYTGHHNFFPRQTQRLDRPKSRPQLFMFSLQPE